MWLRIEQQDYGSQNYNPMLLFNMDVFIFQSYKAMLEKRQESLLSQLEQLHERQELSVMEMFHQIGSTVEKIDRGCESQFTDH